MGQGTSVGMKKTESDLIVSSAAGQALSDYIFRLYVSGATDASTRAIVNIRRLCEQYLHGRYQLEILNISDHVRQATQDQIFAAPTLVRIEPLPHRRFIGDMSDASRFLQGLNISPHPETEPDADDSSDS